MNTLGESSPPSVSVTKCWVWCQKAALHFDDDSLWQGAFDPLPSFVNKEYTLIDVVHIMAVWELAEEKKTCLSCWKAPCLCCWRPNCRKVLLWCFQHLNLYNDYYGRLNFPAACFLLLCHLFDLIDTHGSLKQSALKQTHMDCWKWIFISSHTHTIWTMPKNDNTGQTQCDRNVLVVY